jgi:hypothetical protein
MKSACAISYSHLWPVCLYHVFHVISYTAQFSETIIEHKMCCDILYNLCLKIVSL